MARFLTHTLSHVFILDREGNQLWLSLSEAMHQTIMSKMPQDSEHAHWNLAAKFNLHLISIAIEESEKMEFYLEFYHTQFAKSNLENCFLEHDQGNSIKCWVISTAPTRKQRHFREEKRKQMTDEQMAFKKIIIIKCKMIICVTWVTVAVQENCTHLTEIAKIKSSLYLAMHLHLTIHDPMMGGAWYWKEILIIH